MRAHAAAIANATGQTFYGAAAAARYLRLKAKACEGRLAVPVVVLKEKRQRTAALQDASRFSATYEIPTAFGVRQSSAAFAMIISCQVTRNPMTGSDFAQGRNLRAALLLH